MTTPTEAYLLRIAKSLERIEALLRPQPIPRQFYAPPPVPACTADELEVKDAE